MVLFLHLLMMAPTLLSLSCSDEYLHGLEDLVHPSEMTVHKVFVVHLQEPMIFFILFMRPMPTIYLLCLLIPLIHLFASFRHTLN